MQAADPSALGSAKLGVDVIMLGACGAEEELPSNPDLPADLFTCCLTTPLRVALRHACRSELLQACAPMVLSPSEYGGAARREAINSVLALRPDQTAAPSRSLPSTNSLRSGGGRGITYTAGTDQ